MKKFYALMLAVGFLTVGKISASEFEPAPRIDKTMASYTITEGMEVFLEYRVSPQNCQGQLYIDDKPATNPPKVDPKKDTYIKKEVSFGTFRYTIYNLPAGKYKFTFKATNNSGTASTTATITVKPH